ncbi:hypothetical protein [Aminiphilus circumscriptus]|uniref:hypothetical protein n=1 Tax=Aminiphilus circumscriptus TaxID=290732 RepID=UPI0004785712|nr:hypothetical protein [Aminiphilus circumscriptus]
MKNLLMIESWCFASGMLFPRKIREMGHGFVLVTRNPEFYHRYTPSGERHPVVALADDVVVCDTNNLSALTDACREICSGSRPDGKFKGQKRFEGALVEEFLQGGEVQRDYALKSVQKVLAEGDSKKEGHGVGCLQRTSNPS